MWTERLATVLLPLALAAPALLLAAALLAFRRTRPWGSYVGCSALMGALAVGAAHGAGLPFPAVTAPAALGGGLLGTWLAAGLNRRRGWRVLTAGRAVLLTALGAGVTTVLALAALALLLVEGGWGGRRLAGDDCHPRRLARLEACRGEDQGFIECRSWLRALGRPEEAWCRAFLAAPAPPPAPACGFAGPAGWAEVPCERFGLQGLDRCFRCGEGEPEAGRDHVIGFSRDCARGAEQHTCNYPMDQAVRQLAAPAGR